VTRQKILKKKKKEEIYSIFLCEKTQLEREREIKNKPRAQTNQFLHDAKSI
jgi:hypothetical protein